MKICFLAGADSNHSKKWIDYFVKKGHEIHWISFRPLTVGKLDNVKFYLVQGNFLLSVIKIKGLLREINPDILHAHYAGKNGLAASLSGFHPFILTAWGSDILIATKSIIKKNLIRFTLSKANLITCDAYHMKEAMLGLGVDSSKIKIINFGIDINKFCPELKDKQEKSSSKTLTNSIVISLRNFEPVYDIETLIEAIPIILEETPDAKFLIAGKGSDEKNIKACARKKGVMKNIKFLGWISNKDLLNYLRLSDVYVSTSLSDAGISSSTAEAMSCALPVVITNTGENRRWIDDDKGGYVVPVKNPKVLAEKVIKLLKNRETRDKFGKTNRETIKRKNNYYVEMGKMEKIYQEIIVK